MVASVVIILNFNSCGKYEDGPNFSLRSKKARLTGEWEVVKMADEYIDQNSYGVDFEFDKDGDFKYSYSYTYGGATNSYSYSGVWEWKDNKEEVRLKINIPGSTPYDLDFKILRLTNDELNLEDIDGKEWELEKK